MDKTSALDAVINYLKGIDSGAEIDDQTDLIDSNILTSLNMMGLVVIIEKVRGTQLDLQDIDITKMRTLDLIKQNYLAM